MSEHRKSLIDRIRQYLQPYKSYGLGDEEIEHIANFTPQIMDAKGYIHKSEAVEHCEIDYGGPFCCANEISIKLKDEGENNGND